MGVLEDLAASLVTNEAQKAIAGDNTYYNLKAVPDQLGGLVQNLATQAPGRFSTGELAGGSLITGLLSGLLGGAGDNYQTTLTDRYSNIVKNAIGGTPSVDDGGLSSGLFKQANQSGQLFRAQQTLKQLEAKQDLNNEIEKATALQGVKDKGDRDLKILELAVKYPRQMEKILGQNKEVVIGGDAEDSNIVKTPTTPTETASQYNFPRQPEALPDRVQAEIDAIMEANPEASYPQARMQVQPLFKPETESASKALKELNTGSANIDKTQQLNDQAKAAIREAGYTGTANYILDPIERLWGNLPSWVPGADAAQADIAAQDLLDSPKGPLATAQKEIGTGVFTDRDQAGFEKNIASSTKQPAVNRVLTDSIDIANKRKKDKIEFFSFWNSTIGKGSLDGAQEAWDKYLNDNPVFNGKNVNKNQPSIFDFYGINKRATPTPTATPQANLSQMTSPLTPDSLASMGYVKVNGGWQKAK